MSHWLISKTYWASAWGLYDVHGSDLHGSIWIISTIFKLESNRIHASGIKVFFIRNEYVHILLNMKSIQSSSDKLSLYISHNWRDSLLSAISRLKHMLSQQIFGLSFSHASYLKMRKDVIKSRMKMMIQIVILADFFMKSCYVVNIWLIVISTVGRNPYEFYIMWISQSQASSKWYGIVISNVCERSNSFTSFYLNLLVLDLILQSDLPFFLFSVF